MIELARNRSVRSVSKGDVGLDVVEVASGSYRVSMGIGVEGRIGVKQ
jgi:hypothetical protein